MRNHFHIVGNLAALVLIVSIIAADAASYEVDVIRSALGCQWIQQTTRITLAD